MYHSIYVIYDTMLHRTIYPSYVMYHRTCKNHVFVVERRQPKRTTKRCEIGKLLWSGKKRTHVIFPVGGWGLGNVIYSLNIPQFFKYKNIIIITNLLHYVRELGCYYITRWAIGELEFYSLFCSVQTGSGGHPSAYRMNTWNISAGKRRPERRADHKPLSAVEVNSS
jgi:hypothetical protein